jgi:hypothetical protein
MARQGQARLGEARRVTFLYKKGFIVKAWLGGAGQGWAGRGEARQGEFSCSLKKQDKQK